MFSRVAELVFVISGVIVGLLSLLRMRRLSNKEGSAAAAAAFGLLLCGRYAALIHGDADWIFTIAVGLMMALLAYNSLGFDHEAAAK